MPALMESFMSLSPQSSTSSSYTDDSAPNSTLVTPADELSQPFDNLVFEPTTSNDGQNHPDNEVLATPRPPFAKWHHESPSKASPNHIPRSLSKAVLKAKQFAQTLSVKSTTVKTSTKIRSSSVFRAPAANTASPILFVEQESSADEDPSDLILEGEVRDIEPQMLFSLPNYTCISLHNVPVSSYTNRDISLDDMAVFLTELSEQDRADRLREEGVVLTEPLPPITLYDILKHDTPPPAPRVTAHIPADIVPPLSLLQEIKPIPMQRTFAQAGESFGPSTSSLLADLATDESSTSVLEDMDYEHDDEVKSKSALPELPTTLSGLATLAARSTLFLPWCIAVGGSILLSPRHLDAIAFSPRLGYVGDTPPTGLRRFAHWAGCGSQHVMIFIACILVVLWNYPALGLAIACAVGGGTVLAWSDFVADKEGKTKLGEDDRQSLYMVLTNSGVGEHRCVVGEGKSCCEDC